ncbi:MAG TPA: hypothetical protein VL404_04245 [Candidatus Eisenbacteria bacterium]|jgi:hypothetical protein|nr:hypothetical protein [Candidatus Eisenbacteria bacterium]
MKKIAFVVLAAGMLAAAPPARAEEPAAAPGRYQLFQGRYSQWDADKDTGTEKNDLFMIDTATGDTWFYVAAAKGGKESRYWVVAVYDEKTPGDAAVKKTEPSGEKRNEPWQKL